MKKVLMLLVAGVFISTTLISCSKKCGHCEINGTKGVKYCSEENYVVYDAAVASCATGGGTWVKQ